MLGPMPRVPLKMIPLHEPSIKDICAPLSAKVMPKGYAYSIGSIETTRSELIAKQRASVANSFNVGQRKDRRK